MMNLDVLLSLGYGNIPAKFFSVLPFRKVEKN
jgi:hypothetical protein